MGTTKNEHPNILVIDDNRSIRYLLKIALVNAGYEVVEASRGQEAFDLLNSMEVRVILLDIELHNEDGVEVLKKIRENPATQHIPIIMLTAHSTANYVKECAPYGIQGFISKMASNASISEVVIERIEKALSDTQHAGSADG